MAIIWYKASDIILWIHADASYLSLSRARIQAGGSHYLSNNSDNQPNNGAINKIWKIMGNVIVSVVKAKIGSTYINDQDSAPLKTLLINMGHPQPSTNLQIDNKTTEAFSEVTLKHKWSKSIDMHFDLLQDHNTQGRFDIFLCPGKDNLVGYLTKYHSLDHHCLMRSKFLHTEHLINNLQLCLLQGSVKFHVNVRTHTQDNIPEESAKPYIFYPVAKKTETTNINVTK